MKLNNIALLITLLFLLCNCDKAKNTITNHITEENLIYNSSYANFKSLNDGIEKYFINLEWEDYLGADFVSYEILENNNPIYTINNANTINQTINMNLNEFKEISFKLNTNLEEQNITTIKIFTRPVYPITNFSVVAYSSYNKLSWNASIDSDIQQIVIYRAELPPGSDLPLINDIDGSPDGNIWVNISESNPSQTSYTDNNVLINSDYYYIIKTIDTNEGYRYSYMTSNISGAIDSGIIFGLTNNYTLGLTSSEVLNSQIFSDKTSFSWNSYSYDDFYEFEIWKSENQNFEIGSSEASLISIITDPIIASFEDYNNVGENKTWYYKIRLKNIYGNFIDSEIIECNTSL